MTKKEITTVTCRYLTHQALIPTLLTIRVIDKLTTAVAFVARHHTLPSAATAIAGGLLSGRIDTATGTSSTLIFPITAGSTTGPAFALRERKHSRAAARPASDLLLSSAVAFEANPTFPGRDVIAKYSR